MNPQATTTTPPASGAQPYRAPAWCHRSRLALAAGLLSVGALSASAALVTYTNNDALNSSSFTSGCGITNWDSAQAPTAGNDYLVAGSRTLRSPTNGMSAAAYIFAGDSLTLGAGSGGSGGISLKCSNTLTVANLIITNGNISNGDTGNTPKTGRVAGNFTILTNASITPTDTNRNIIIAATLAGPGNLSIANRGIVMLGGTHSYSGPLSVSSVMLDMDGTTVITPGSLYVGRDSTFVTFTNATSTNIVAYGTTNIVRAGGKLNVGYGPTSDLRVGWRTSNNTNNNVVATLDVSSQPLFTANVGNFTVGYSAASSSGTRASAAGFVYLATNNVITAMNVVLGDTVEGESTLTSQVTLGRGNNLLDSPIMVVGARKQPVILTLPAGGTLVLTNSAAERMDLTVGGNTTGTSGVPTDRMDLSGGPLIASLGNLILGQKTGGNSGGVTATLTLATNAANAVDVNYLTLGSMAGNDTPSASAASGTLNFNGGVLKVNNDLALAGYDFGYGAALGVLNLNAGTVTVSGNIFNAGGLGTINLNAGTLNVAGELQDGSGGTNVLNLNGGLLDLWPAGDPAPGSLAANTLVLKGTLTNASALNVINLSGTGTSVSQTGLATVTGTLNPGTATTPGTLTLGSLLVDATATVRFNLTNTATPGGGVNDLLDIKGDLSFNPGATLAFAMTASTLDTTTPYRLANYTGEIIGLDTLTYPLTLGRYTLSVVANTSSTPKHLNLVVSGQPAGLLWTGAIDGSTWDVNSYQNWLNLGTSAADTFLENDNVRFDDSSIYPNVNLAVDVQPGLMVVSNNVNPYVFGSYSGNGIVGPGGLTKSGPGTLTLGTSNTFTGPVAINAGLVIAGAGTAFGATNNGTTIASGATLDVNNQNLGSELIHVRGAGFDGNGAIINSDLTNPLGARNATRYVVLDGDTTFGGAGRWDMRGTSLTGSASLLGTNYVVTKVGTNGVFMTDGTVVNVGNVQVNAGSFVIESASTINPNASINLSNGGALSFYRLYYPMGRNVTVGDLAMIRATSNTTNAQNEVAGAVTVNGQGILSVSGGAQLNISGPVVGSGEVVKADSGTAVLLNGTNNWHGGTTISNGTLSIGNGFVNGSLPAFPVVITNYGTMMYNLVSNTTVTTAHEITGPGGFRKIGDGTLSMTVSNSFTGLFQTGDGSSLSGGIIRLLNRYAFGDPSISKTVEVVRAEVRLEGGMDIAANVLLRTSANSALTGFGGGYVALRNMAGTNTIASAVELYAGAGNSEFTSDAGLLVMNGPIFLGNNANRNVVLSGTNTGFGIVNGPISNQPTNTVALQKTGASTWTLTAASTYSGATTVSGGTLLINGSIGGSTVSVQSGATLGGSGSIGVPVTVQLGGTLAPGTSIGTLTLTSNLTLQGKAVMEVARNGAVLANDRISGVVTNTYGGTLIVTNTGTSALQAGDSFKLFSSAVYLGAFTNIVYPTGYTWTNSLAVDGTVSVVAVSGPPTLKYTFSGSSLTFTWTGSYKLQAQTNTLAVGVSNNWYNVVGGGTSGVSVPVSAANGTVFFRLAQ